MWPVTELKSMYLGEGLSGWFYRIVFERSEDIHSIASRDIPNHLFKSTFRKEQFKNMPETVAEANRRGVMRARTKDLRGIPEVVPLTEKE